MRDVLALLDGAGALGAKRSGKDNRSWASCRNSLLLMGRSCRGHSGGPWLEDDSIGCPLLADGGVVGASLEALFVEPALISGIMVSFLVERRCVWCSSWSSETVMIISGVVFIVDGTVYGMLSYREWKNFLRKTRDNKFMVNIGVSFAVDSRKL